MLDNACGTTQCGTTQMYNCYLKNPVKVVSVDPKTGKNLQTFVFLGDIPATVKNAVYSYKAAIDKNNQQSAKKHIPVLKEYYGADWDRKLHLSSRKKGGHEGWNEEVIDESITSQQDEESAYGEHDARELRSLARAQPSAVGAYDDIMGIDVSEIDKMLNLELFDETAATPTDKKNLAEDDFIYTEEEDAGKNEPQKISAIDITGVDFRTKFSRNGGVTFVNDVKIYPEDKLFDVKQKIHIALGIPFYRSHLYWIQNGRAMTTYKIITNKLYPVDIRDLLNNTKSDNQEMLGVKIDRELYNERADIKVEANDTFEIIANLTSWGETFYVCDLADYVEVVKSQLINIVRDKYQLDLYYFGFVIKYWPQLVYEAFTEYILAESSLMQKFPDLSVPISHIKKVYSTEAEILDKNYKNVKRIMDLDAGEGRKRIYIAVTHAIATSKLEYKMIVNIRNLFDKMRTSKQFPEVKAYVSHDGKEYLLEKHYVGGARIQFPTGMRTGVIIAVNISSAAYTNRYLFVNITNNGKYYIKTSWNEEEELQLIDVMHAMKKHTDGLFSLLNSMGKYIFVIGNGFPLLTESTVKYQSVNVSILWKHVMSIGAYRFVKSLWDPYIRAGIMSAHGIAQMDATNFIFHKAMIQFDTSLIYRVTAAAHIVSSKNQYTRLTNSTIKQKWNQLYGGRIFKMYHRTTDLKFEAVNVREEEFKLIYRYVLMFVSKAMCNPKINQISAEKTYNVGTEGIKKLRKLQETDPDLYNLKKFGSNKMYSILCQNPRQPIIYTDDEIDRMSAKERAKLTKYWNFTLDREAYYGCENSKYPHMAFIVGVHPKNYCLPCCSKKQFTVEESKKMQINKICMQNYEFGKGDKLKEISSRHVMVYGKSIEPGRISQLPGSAIRDLLYNSLNDPTLQYYIFGVPQSFPSVKNSGLIYAIAEALSVTPQDLVNTLIKHLNSMKEVFSTLLNGTVSTEFKNMNELTETMRELFITRSDAISKISFNNWSELFMELAMIFMNIYVFTFIDDTERGETTDLYISDAMKSELMYMQGVGITINEANESKYLLMIKKKGEYYPIFVTNPSVYFRTNTPSKKLFSNSDTVVKLLYSLVSSNSIEQANMAGEKTINKDITLQIVKEFASSQYKIEKKYINKRNLCYAVDINMGQGNVYAAVDYSPHISDGIKIDFNIPEGDKYDAKILLAYASEMNKFIKKKYTIGKNAAQKEMHEYNLIHFDKLYSYNGMISSASSRNIYYFAPIKESDAVELFSKYAPEVVKVNYSYEDINKAVATSTPPKKISQKLINKSLYNNYLYQLFVIEFVNHITKETNAPLRESIYKLINSTDFKKGFTAFQQKISSMLEEFPDDKAVMITQITTFYYGDFDKKKLIADIKSTRYQYDNITINGIKKLEHSEIKKELRSIAKDFVSESEIDENGEFPNVYLPCSDSHEKALYCSGKKLIVGDQLDKLVDILASDIMNPLKEKYLLSGIFDDTIVEYFNFIINPMETIMISKIE